MIANLSQTQTMAWRLVSDPNLRAFNLYPRTGCEWFQKSPKFGDSLHVFSLIRLVLSIRCETYPLYPTVGFSKPLKIKHVVQHLHRVRTLNLTGARVHQQGKEQTRFLKKASGIHNCSIDLYHLTTSYQAFPIEQQHFWGCKISCVPIFRAFFELRHGRGREISLLPSGQWQEAQETRPERGETQEGKP